MIMDDVIKVRTPRYGQFPTVVAFLSSLYPQVCRMGCAHNRVSMLKWDNAEAADKLPPLVADSDKISQAGAHSLAFSRGRPAAAFTAPLRVLCGTPFLC